ADRLIEISPPSGKRTLERLARLRLVLIEQYRETVHECVEHERLRLFLLLFTAPCARNFGREAAIARRRFSTRRHTRLFGIDGGNLLAVAIDGNLALDAASTVAHAFLRTAVAHTLGLAVFAALVFERTRRRSVIARGTDRL